MSCSEDGELCFSRVVCRCHFVSSLRGPDKAATPWFCSSMLTKLPELGKFPVGLRVPPLVRSVKRENMKASPSGMSQRATAPLQSSSGQVFLLSLACCLVSMNLCKLAKV